MAIFQSLMWALPTLLQNHLLLIKNAQFAILQYFFCNFNKLINEQVGLF